jgi:hypothetical protein
MYETLTEATQSSEQCAVQLFFAVRNIFELFCSVIPTFHRENLLKFPQHSGIIIIYFILSNNISGDYHYLYRTISVMMPTVKCRYAHSNIM